jgi:hypothetical protein
MCPEEDQKWVRNSRPASQQQPLARNVAIDEFPIDVLAEPRSARAKPAEEIGRTDGVGARRRRREHLQALRTPGRDVHATGTARIKAGDKRRTEAENHDNARRIARTGSHSRTTELSALTLS